MRIDLVVDGATVVENFVLVPGENPTWSVADLTLGTTVEIGIRPHGIDPGQVGGGKVGRKHPRTSRRAAQNVGVGSQLAHLLFTMRAAGWSGLTCAQAAPIMADRLGRPFSRNQTSTRMGELCEGGFVALTGHERETENGNTARVWRITDAGIAEARRLLAKANRWHGA